MRRPINTTFATFSEACLFPEHLCDERRRLGGFRQDRNKVAIKIWNQPGLSNYEVLCDGLRHCRHRVKFMVVTLMPCRRRICCSEQVRNKLTGNRCDKCLTCPRAKNFQKPVDRYLVRFVKREILD